MNYHIQSSDSKRNSRGDFAVTGSHVKARKTIHFVVVKYVMPLSACKPSFHRQSSAQTAVTRGGIAERAGGSGGGGRGEGGGEGK